MKWYSGKRLLGVGLGLIALVLGWPVTGQAQKKPAAATATPSAPAQKKAAAAALPLAPVKTLGSKSAPIVMEVFSDYQCPACGQLYLQTLRQVIDNDVAAGRVYLVHRDYPLPIHKYSREAARWANAAAEIGKFEKVEDALYTKREAWENNGNIEAVVAAVLSPAELKKARALVQGGKLDTVIEKDIALGNTFRVQSTPHTVVTCRGQLYPVVGIVSYSILRRFFDDLLRQ